MVSTGVSNFLPLIFSPPFDEPLVSKRLGSVGYFTPRNTSFISRLEITHWSDHHWSDHFRPRRHPSTSHRTWANHSCQGAHIPVKGRQGFFFALRSLIRLILRVAKYSDLSGGHPNGGLHSKNTLCIHFGSRRLESAHFRGRCFASFALAFLLVFWICSVCSLSKISFSVGREFLSVLLWEEVVRQVMLKTTRGWRVAMPLLCRMVQFRWWSVHIWMCAMRQCDLSTFLFGVDKLATIQLCRLRLGVLLPFFA